MSLSAARRAVPVVWRLLEHVAAWQRAVERRRWVGLALFLLVVAAAVGTRMIAADARARLPDREHAAIALRLLEVSVARPLKATPASAAPSARAASGLGNPSRERAAPGYALVLAVAAMFDHGVHSALECRLHKTSCGEASIASLLVAQFVVVMLSLMLAMATAWRLSGSWSVAFLTGVLVFVGSPAGEPASYPLPYVWPPFLLYLSAFLLVVAFDRRSFAVAVLAGAALAAVALFLPLMVVAAPLTALALTALHAARHRVLEGALHGAMVLAGAGLVVGGVWLLLVVPGHYAPSAAVRGIAYDLALRAGFQSMDLATAFAGIALPLPIVGGLFEAIVPADLTHPFGPFVAGTYLTAGDAVVYRAAITASPFASEQLGWIWSNRIVAEPVGYLLSTPAVLMRGVLGNADLVGLIGLLHIPTMIAWHRVDARLGLLGVVAVPFVVLLILGTLLTASLPFASMSLGFLLAYAIAYVAGRL